MKLTCLHLLESESAIVRWVHHTRIQRVAEAASRYASPTKTALDYSCGDGYLVRQLSPHFSFVAGSEIGYGKIETAHSLGVPNNGWVGHSDELVQVAESRVPYGFDVIIMSQVVEHVSDVMRDYIFDHLREVSHANTRLVIEVPIESGPILAMKAVAGPILTKFSRGGYTRDRYTVGEVLRRLSINRAPHVRPPTTNGAYYGHKDFSVWNL